MSSQVASWDQVVALFHDLSILPAAERESLLSRCADEALREEVSSLLRAHDFAGSDSKAELTATVSELSPEAAALVPGRRIGPYTVLRELGEGGMSRVFLAARADAEFDRLVAVKVMRSAGPSAELLERFRIERQVLANLEHANIARLYEGGTTDRGIPFIVMEYIAQGRAIDRYCCDEELPAAARAGLFRTVCEAVAYAHRSLVVHRDLKPSNILITTDGTVKLLDFGISKLLHPESFDLTMTAAGPRPMTPSYASPEQILGHATTTASDVFSLGVVFYRILTGTLPFGSSLSERIGELARETDPTRPSAIAPAGGEAALSLYRPMTRAQREDLDAILVKCLERNPLERYESVSHLIEDLDRWQEGRAVVARRPTLGYRLSRGVRRHRLPVALATFAVLSLVGGIAGLAHQSGKLAEQRDVAEHKAEESDQLLELMMGLFDQVDPALSRGATITVREVFNQAERRVATELDGRPELRATLLNRIGRIYYQLGLPEDAERVVREAGRLVVSGSPESATHLELLGTLRHDRGDPREGLQLQQQALELRRALHGESLEVARSLTAMAKSLDALARFDESERRAREALETLTELDQLDTDAAAEAWFYLGESFVKRHRHEEGLRFFRDGLATARRVLGHDHPRTLRYLLRISVLRMEDPGGLEEAETLAQEALAAQERLYDGDHPDLAVTLDTLGNIRRKRGDLAGARHYLEQSHAMIQRVAGEESVGAAVALTNLGWLYLFAADDPVRSEPLFRRSLELEERFFPPNAPLLSYPLLGLGRSMTLNGQPAEGERFLRRALELRSTTYDGSDPAIASARTYLAECLGAQGRFEEAQAELVKVRRTLRAAELPSGDGRAAFNAVTAELFRRWGRPIPPALRLLEPPVRAASGADDRERP